MPTNGSRRGAAERRQMIKEYTSTWPNGVVVTTGMEGDEAQDVVKFPDVEPGHPGTLLVLKRRPLTEIEVYLRGLPARCPPDFG
jgi:hypothetical protein